MHVLPAGQFAVLVHWVLLQLKARLVVSTQKLPPSVVGKHLQFEFCAHWLGAVVTHVVRASKLLQVRIHLPLEQTVVLGQHTLLPVGVRHTVPPLLRHLLRKLSA